MVRKRRPRPRRGRWRKLGDAALGFAILGLAAIVAARLEQANTVALQGRAEVHDGDTLSLDGERIRLAGIDAPELRQTCRRGREEYPCGELSRDRLRDAVRGASLSCEGEKQDRYGRLLARCMAGTVDLGEEQVREGWAVAYGGYGAEERQARERGLGLWAGEFERPRDWRVRHGEAADEPAAGAWLSAILAFFGVR